MSKKQVTIKIDKESASDVFDALEQSQKGHSFDFPTQRIKNIREVMIAISSQLFE